MTTWYKFQPNLQKVDRESLLAFAQDRNYELYSRAEDLFESQVKIFGSPDIHLSLEDVLSTAIPVHEAFQRLSLKLATFNPEKTVLFVDPYIFPRKCDVDYVSNISKLFNSIDPSVEIDIVTRKDYNDKTFIDIKKLTNSQINLKTNDDIHDRFWIVDSVKGILLGNSLNGIGRRYVVYTNLEKADCEELSSLIKSMA